MEKITIVLADDHTIVRQGLCALLKGERDLEVVGEAETGRQAVQLTRSLLPQVTIMDISMPLLNGLEAARQILHERPSARVLVLSSYRDPEYVRQSTEAGAAGYLVKESAAQELIKAIRIVIRGGTYYSPGITAGRGRSDPGRGLPRNGWFRRGDGGLTAREREVLQLIAEGQANKQIAAELGVSIKTVEKHRQQVMNKLNIHQIAGLTCYAIAQGIIENPAPARCEPLPESAPNGPRF
jgi:DNA-binding NarL/FixJ family response regulator